MKTFPTSIKAADEKIQTDILNLVNSVRTQTEKDPVGIPNGIALLSELRSAIYEDLNQIQHEELIVRSVEWLKINGYGKTKLKWYWNPRQTGGATEPDIRIESEDVVIVSAEASTSLHPNGSIDVRMKNTLEKLSCMEGKKFYFVRTPEMEKRATSKLLKSNWEIEVVTL